MSDYGADVMTRSDQQAGLPSGRRVGERSGPGLAEHRRVIESVGLSKRLALRSHIATVLEHLPRDRDGAGQGASCNRTNRPQPRATVEGSGPPASGQIGGRVAVRQTTLVTDALQAQRLIPNHDRRGFIALTQNFRPNRGA